MKKFLPTLVRSWELVVGSKDKKSTNYELPAKRTTNQFGFTLIELLVVITIIAFLAVIGIVAFTNAQAQARDGRRRADIDVIATALEANTNPLSTTLYPAVAAGIFANGTIPFDPTQTSSAGTATYTGNTYSYTATASIVAADSKSYTVCALLEKATGNFAPIATAISPTAVTGCTPGIPATNNGWCYCRKNQQ